MRQKIGRALVTTLGLVATIAVTGTTQTRRVDNVVLITLDGVRTQEIFGGLDLDVLQATSAGGPVQATPSYRRYWAPTPEARREKLMPFFWGTLMTRYGSIAGNRALGSTVEVTNTHRFSYPGYAEILTGHARDAAITSNANRRYPFETVLEFLKGALDLPETQVAAFGSWETFRWIAAHESDAIAVNAGFEGYDHPDPAIQALSRQQFETPTPWNAVRHDFYTFRFARAHLRTYHPRVLYLALGETDDWAHDGRYDRVLGALARTDTYLRQLWEFLQSDAQYRDRTALLITVDHGRGRTASDWKDHGREIDGSQDIWMAFVTPHVPLRGEWRDHDTLYQDQVAATLAGFLGLDFTRRHPDAGKPVARLFPN